MDVVDTVDDVDAVDDVDDVDDVYDVYSVDDADGGKGLGLWGCAGHGCGCVFLKNFVDFCYFSVFYRSEKGAGRKYEQNRGSSASRSFSRPQMVKTSLTTKPPFWESNPGAIIAMAVAVAMGHGHGARSTVPAHKLEAPAPILEEQWSNTCAFFNQKLRGTCWHLHGSAVTLTFSGPPRAQNEKWTEKRETPSYECCKLRI